MRPHTPELNKRRQQPAVVMLELPGEQGIGRGLRHFVCPVEDAFQNGLCVMMPRPLRRGMRVVVRARLARDLLVRLVAEVRWVDQDRDGYWAGLRLLNKRQNDVVCWNQAIWGQV